MVSTFDGRTARHYRHFRRDVVQNVIDQLVETSNWSASSHLIDLGCGTGQATMPLAKRVGSVLACDASDENLVAIVDALDHRVDGLVIANALHWMDEDAVFAGLPGVLRQGGTFAVITHGPPLWLGDSPWQRSVRRLLEELIGPLSATCGSDDGPLHRRERLLGGLCSEPFCMPESHAGCVRRHTAGCRHVNETERVVTAYDPPAVPPEAYANPFAAGAVTMQMICDGVRGGYRLVRRRREVRMLNRIGVLPSNWDAAGRLTRDSA